MSDLLNRRVFLRTAAVVTAGSVLSLTGVEGGCDATRHWVTHTDEWEGIRVHAYGLGDKYGRNQIIAAAVPILHARFRSLEVLHSVYARLGNGGYQFGRDVWKASNLEAHPKYGYSDLLRYQMDVLRQPASEGSSVSSFPDIHVHPYYQKDGALAYVDGRDLGCVQVRYDDVADESLQSGEFKVYVNLWHLGSVNFDPRDPPRTMSCDPFFWAHVIAHEMLHNLGHRHNQDDYEDTWQINAFHRAFYGLGNPGKQVPASSCGAPR